MSEENNKETAKSAVTENKETKKKTNKKTKKNLVPSKADEKKTTTKMTKKVVEKKKSKKIVEAKQDKEEKKIIPNNDLDTHIDQDINISVKQEDKNVLNLEDTESKDINEHSTINEEVKNTLEKFDWENAVKDDQYSVKERKGLEKEYESTLTEIIDNQVLDGTVVTITDRELSLIHI